MGLKNVTRVFPTVVIMFIVFVISCSAERKVPCGQRQLSFLGLVVKGQSAVEADYPWHGALFSKEGKGRDMYLCGGTVIDKNLIVTAAHCTVLYRVAKPAELFHFKLGLHNKSSPNENTMTYEIVEIIRHREFSISDLKNDIALLRTAEDITYTDYIQPICLWPVEKSDLSSVVGSSGTVVGWGLADDDKPADILQFATLSVVDHAKCLQSNPGHFSKLLTEDGRNYCAGNQNMTNVCDGDSGGGMYFKVDNTWYIRGIVSAGARGDKYCNPNEFVTFTDIPYYLKWIVEHQKAVKQRNLLDLGNCGLDNYGSEVAEKDKSMFLQYPWMAILEYKTIRNSTIQTFCNGALIHPRFVVTVGHCIASDTGRIKLVSVRLGEFDLGTNPDKGKDYDGKEISTSVQSIAIEKTFRHPQFNIPRYDNNIALLQLKTPADVLRQNVKPICLPTLDDYSENYTLTGWTRIGSSTLAKNLVYLEDHKACSSLFASINITLASNNNQICGSYPYENVPKCFQSMSGAPLQYVKNVDRKNRYFLRGIFSFGYPKCNENHTVVFANVNNYAVWIKSIIDAEMKE